jgi:hypothetical protein
LESAVGEFTNRVCPGADGGDSKVLHA